MSAGSAGAQGASTEVVAEVDGQPPVDRATFDRWMRIQAKSGPGDGRVPDHPGYRACAQRLGTTAIGRGRTFAQRQATCATQWRALRDGALGTLLLVAWTRGEAAERGLALSEAEVTRRFEELKQQAAPDPAGFGAYLRASGFTEADIRMKTEAGELERAIRDAVTSGVPAPTRDQVDAYYRANRAEFRAREARDVRYVQTRTRRGALRARAALERGRTWKAVVRAYSNEGGPGLLLGVERGQTIARFDKAAFAAKLRVLVGPFRSGKHWYVIRVGRITPARQRPLSEVRGTIGELLEAQGRKRVLDAFEVTYRGKWRLRTRCLTDYVAPECGATLPTLAPPA